MSAFVDGMIPPASPSRNRLRQLSREPSAGRWRWAGPPWEWVPSAAWSWSWSWSASAWIVTVRRSTPASGSRRDRARAELADQQPGADAEDEDPRRDRGPAVEGLGRQDAAERDDDGREDDDPERVRHGHAQPERHRVDRRPAGADEVGTHQRLAVARRQGVPGAEGHGRDERAEEDERGEVARLEQVRDLGADAARDRERRCHRIRAVRVRRDR